MRRCYREDSWERRRELIFELELHRAECEFLTGELSAAEERLAGLSNRTGTTVERATVACLHMDVYTMIGQSSRAVAVGLDYLRHVDIDWLPHPTDEDVKREYERIWSQLGSRTIEDLIELPLMTDPASLATLDVLTRLGPFTLSTDANLFSLTICRAVNLSLERGNSDGSCYAYVRFGTIAGAKFGDYEVGYRFGQLGYDLVEGRGLKRFQARTYLTFGNVILPLRKHVRAGRELVRRAFEATNQTGDLTFAAFSCILLNNSMLAAGDPLLEVQGEAEHGLAFAENARFGIVIDVAATQLALVRTLRGLTPTFGSLDDGQFDELRIERRFASNPDLARAEYFYWLCKLQARFLANDHGAAIAASSRAQRLLWQSPSLFDTADYHLYSALSRAAACESLGADQRQQHVEALTAHHRQLEVWAGNCAENFENRAALVGAEIARIEGRDLDAMRIYEQAIHSARANRFVHNEALANEIAARFYAARGFETIAQSYLRNARHCYLRWGADGKVRQLDEMYPHLRQEEPAPGPTSTIGAPVEQLDLATVIKVSQAVSGEIVLEKLIDTLMRTALEQAGAERGLLILPRGAEQRIAAEATTSGDTVTVHLRDEIVTAPELSESVLHYVLHTQESMILDNAAAQNPFSADPYIRERQARSILCLPLINQGRLNGVLYLENNLARSVFAPARIAVLKLLASQAAISLENTRLYRDLAEREAKIRRLVNANIIGIFAFALEGQIIEANDAFLHMVGYDRGDLAAGRLSWTDLTPPEWLDRDERQWVPELIRTGILLPFEKEYFRKDGSRVPVLIGVATFDESENQGVAFVLDLTERKRAEEALRAAQAELAHVNRVATMGQMTASIAHEVKQPIAGAVSSAQAALRWLDAQPPDLEKIRQSLGRIISNGFRASEVIDRVRALVKKAPSRNEQLDINEVILEVVALTRSEVLRNGVSLRTELANGLPLAQGDRIQLQQVVLNLIMNAIEAMTEVGGGARELLIDTGKDASDGALVAVRDSGPGLDPKSFDRLFDAFYTTKPSGMGMGLSICRSIIEAHGGRLWAEANAPCGAVFQFTLPAHRPPHHDRNSGNVGVELELTRIDGHP